jgi:hypothetical protein
MEYLQLKKLFVNSQHRVPQILGEEYFGLNGRPMNLGEIPDEIEQVPICLKTNYKDRTKIDINLLDAWQWKTDYPGCRICMYRDECNVAQICSKENDCIPDLSIDFISEQNPNFDWTTLKPCKILNGVNCIRRALEDGICSTQEIKTLFPYINPNVANQMNIIGNDVNELFASYQLDRLDQDYEGVDKNLVRKLFQAAHILLPCEIADSFTMTDLFGENLDLNGKDIANFNQRLIERTTILQRLTYGVHKILDLTDTSALAEIYQKDETNQSKIKNKALTSSTILRLLGDRYYRLYDDVSEHYEILDTEKRLSRKQYLLDIFRDMVNSKLRKMSGCIALKNGKGRSPGEKLVQRVFSPTNDKTVHRILKPTDITHALLYPVAEQNHITTDSKPGCIECPLNKGCGQLTVLHNRLKIRVIDYFMSKKEVSYYKMLQILDE